MSFQYIFTCSTHQKITLPSCQVCSISYLGDWGMASFQEHETAFGWVWLYVRIFLVRFRSGRIYNLETFSTTEGLRRVKVCKKHNNTNEHRSIINPNTMITVLMCIILWLCTVVHSTQYEASQINIREIFTKLRIDQKRVSILMARIQAGLWKYSYWIRKLFF